MEKQISLQSRSISYFLKKSQRARQIRLAVYSNGSVVLTLPQGFNETAGERFIRRKSSWLLAKIDFFKRFKNTPVIRVGRRDYLKRKGEAQVLARERVARFSRLYGFKVKKIFIKNQKTRWGSCSRKGNLNFNFKILYLSPELQDYVVVHELCHLKEFNHSKNFWHLVAKTMPQWPKLKKELKNYALSL